MTTIRNKPKLFHDGFGYIRDRQSADTLKIFWRCDEKSHGCKARLHTSTDDNHVIAVINDHNHGSNAAKTEVARITALMRTRALQTAETPAQIMNNATKYTSASVQGQLPSRDAARRMIQRQRQAQYPINDQLNLESLIVPEGYREYEYEHGKFEPYLLGDNGVGNVDRVLMFGRETHGLWIQHASSLYVDGTFRIAPPLFAQVFVIMAERGGYVHPVIYFLLPNKKKETYTCAFEMLRAKWPDLNPLSINMDFELSVIQSAMAAFPHARIHGCLFHLTKNMRCQLAAESLYRRYRNDTTFSMQCRMIVALAFIPIDDLDFAVGMLSRDITEELIPVLNWMEDNYIGRLNRDGTRRPARYPPAIWSVYERTLHDDPRTNNYAEAAHRRLQSEFGVDHPSLWKFINALRTVQKGRDAVFEQYIRGDRPRIKRRKYVQADIRIKQLVESYSERTVIEYLRGLSHNFIME
jgi:hypothetical protein